MGAEELSSKGVSEHTGFPNAATDRSLSSLDLSKLLVRHPASTYFMRVTGSSGEAFGIFDGDIAVIDRALKPKAADFVVWWQDEEFVISHPNKVPPQTVVWGVITHIVHAYRETKT